MNINWIFGESSQKKERWGGKKSCLLYGLNGDVGVVVFLFLGTYIDVRIVFFRTFIPFSVIHFWNYLSWRRRDEIHVVARH